MLCFKLKHKTAFITIEWIKKGVYGICGHVQAALMPFVCKIDSNKGENENHKKKPPILQPHEGGDGRDNLVKKAV